MVLRPENVELLSRTLNPVVLGMLKIEQERRMLARPPVLKPHLSLVEDANHPLHDLRRPARYKVYYGGRGSAKSWAFAEEIIKRCVDEPLRVLCTREFQNSIADSVHKLLCDTIERLGLERWFIITAKDIRSKCGASIIFKGLHDNQQEIKSTEGIDICWVEEAQTVAKSSWNTLIPTIRKEGFSVAMPTSEIWISFNPDDYNDDTYRRFVVSPPTGAVVHHVNFDSNPFFPAVLEELRQDYLRSIVEAADDDEREQAQNDYDHVWLGANKRIAKEIILSGKVVMQEFDDKLWKKADTLLFGADFGYAQDPNTLMRFFILDQCLYIEHEAYGVGVDFLGNMVEDKGEMEQFYDSVPLSRAWPIKCDCSRPETISFLRGLGYNASAADKWDGSVNDGIAHLRGFRKIIAHPRCKNFLRESRQYRYKVDKNSGEVLPIIIKKHDHTIDAVRYGLDGYIRRSGDIGMWQRIGKQEAA